MKKRFVKLLVLLGSALVLLSSCGGIKEYAGFSVNKNIIEVAATGEEKLLMPLEMYKAYESEFIKFAEKYNNFMSITSEDFEYFKKLTNDIYSLNIKYAASDLESSKSAFSLIVKDEIVLDSMIKNLNKNLKKIENFSFEKIESFGKELSDYFDILIYIMGEAADFNSGNAPWYESCDDIFDDASDEEETKLSVEFIERYFPVVKFNRK